MRREESGQPNGCLIFAIGVVVVAVVIVIGCSIVGLKTLDIATEAIATRTADTEFTVSLEGTPGLEFLGNCIVWSFSGRSSSRSVEGRVPSKERFTGSAISCAFGKTQERGTLTLKILSDGKILEQSAASAPYGMASAATTRY